MDLRSNRGGAAAVVLGVIALLVVVAAAGVVMFARGTAGIDDWAVRQVVRISNTYLVPEIAFESFDFDAPKTITLEGVTLTAPDSTRVVEAGALVVTLAEAPMIGQPIVIESVDIRSGVVRLIRTPGDGGGFEGLVPFVKPEYARDPNAAPEDVRLNRVLRIRRLALSDASIYYDAGDGRPAMSFDGISLDMNLEPTTDSAGDTWHAITGVVDREPVLRLDLNGRVNLDRFVVQLDETELGVQLGEDTYASFPPELQAPLREYEAQGRLDIVLTGAVPLRDLASADATAHATIESFNVSIGRIRLPIDKGNMTATLAGGAATVDPLRLEALDGVVEASARAELTAAEKPATGQWRFVDMQLEQILRAATPEGEAPRLAGDVKSEGSVQVNLDAIPASLTGSGTLNVTDGRLVSLPLVSGLQEALDVVGMVKGKRGFDDRFDIKFDFSPDALLVSKLDVVTPTMAARGDGKVYYNLDLDLLMNAGPLEKVQSLLGPVGDLLGKITDQIVKYHVSGRVGQPQIKVKPLGIGAAPAEASPAAVSAK